MWTGYTVSSQYFANTNIVIYVTYEDSVDEMSATFTVSDGAPPVRSVMSYTGRVEVPDNFVRIGRKTLQECAAECSANCSCVAYAYATLNGSTANGDSTRCLVWIGDHQLVDTQKMGVLPYSTTDADTQDTLYLRVASLSGTFSYHKSLCVLSMESN
ncbi:hypothetical protein HU200_033991 [Digitaria exilis]|uniref:Apple domain-containing protein n=1 Tax=Digitaria exilis TaxID=1010633 RepID=A0A835BVV0_9POAL|nr:hypothetical protein HU200_033991 [Digitaria exilis]